MKSANVQVFNPTTLKLITTIPADKGAHNVTFSPNGKLAFIANVGANNVTIIDAVTKKALGMERRQWSAIPDRGISPSSMSRGRRPCTRC
jgi:DNA-binding beta-propeller fold protein YncE